MTLKNFCFKSLVIIGLAVMGSTQTQAQVTATTNVNVKLAPILALTVNQAEVNLEFNDLINYQSGVTTAIPGHLTVTSLMPYTITVKANDATFSDGGTTPNKMDVGIVRVGITSSDLGVTPETAAPLQSTSAVTLISEGTPALTKPVDVTYSIPASVSNSAAVLGHPAGTYSQEITYTLTSL